MDRVMVFGLLFSLADPNKLIPSKINLIGLTQFPKWMLTGIFLQTRAKNTHKFHPFSLKSFSNHYVVGMYDAVGLREACMELPFCSRGAASIILQRWKIYPCPSSHVCHSKGVQSLYVRLAIRVKPLQEKILSEQLSLPNPFTIMALTLCLCTISVAQTVIFILAELKRILFIDRHKVHFNIRVG